MIPKNVFAEEIIVDDNLPRLYFRAINPGYTIDGKSNVGEMIEIGLKDSGTPFLLAGATVGYTNSSGNTSILFEFPENSWMTGESILLRLASSPESELAAINYTKTLAYKAGLTLSINGEVIDEVCWNGKTNCAAEFRSSLPTTLLRNIKTNEFEHVSEYKPNFNPEAYLLEQDDVVEVKNQCKGLIFTEVLSYYDTSRVEQFIELYNSSANQILLDGCKIRYKNKTYELVGIVKPEEYFKYLPIEFTLTKNPTNVGVIEIIDVNGEVVDKLEYPNGQRKGTSYALIGFDKDGQEMWRTTYVLTPGEANHYQEFRTCEQGKVINETTGNCVKVTTVAEKICPTGQYLNILTGRCRKYEVTTKRVCQEGYSLNPETGRCRKIKENNGAEYGLVSEEYEKETTFVALYAVIGVLCVGLIYLVYEFRLEIVRLFGKVFRRFR